MEGKRVDQEIRDALRKAQDDAGDDGSPGYSDALGKTIPRESDRKLLEEFENRRQNASRN